MKVLGIETTCDETGAAVVVDGHRILSNIVASSADIHRRYGGVFPELACRRHIQAILPVIEEALERAQVTREEIDLISVAKGPGLVGALLIGMQAAKGLSIAWQKPFIGVNHVEAHLYAAMMEQKSPLFPALGIVLSGGHTLLLKIHDVGHYELLGTTVDDAIGEAFDKVATLLHLPYPGGPEIERLAKNVAASRFSFKAGHVKKSPLNFSFSGLKTAVLYALRGQTQEINAEMAWAFQETAFQDVAHKARQAAATFEPKALYFGGGVCSNHRLREIMAKTFEIPLFWPKPELTLDNAAMIAGLGFCQFAKNPISDPLDLEVQTRIAL